MRENKFRIQSDLSFIGLLLLFFITVLYISSQNQNQTTHIFIFSATIIIMVITYFTNITTGLVLNVLAIFIGFSLLLYESAAKGTPIPSYAYFWSVCCPCYLILLSLFCHSYQEMQKQNANLKNQVNDLVTIDEVTGLHNKKALLHDMETYMGISIRYGHYLTLMVVELRHSTEISSIIGEERKNKLLSFISSTLQETMRKEDLIYLLDFEKCRWAILMMSNSMYFMEQIIDRIKKSIVEIDFSSFEAYSNINVDVKIGYTTFDDGIKTPLEWITLAQKQLEYDV